MVGPADGRLQGVRLAHAWDELDHAARRCHGNAPPINARSGRSTVVLASSVSSRGPQSLKAVCRIGKRTRVAAHIGFSQPAAHHTVR